MILIAVILYFVLTPANDDWDTVLLAMAIDIGGEKTNIADLRRQVIGVNAKKLLQRMIAATNRSNSDAWPPTPILNFGFIKATPVVRKIELSCGFWRRQHGLRTPTDRSRYHGLQPQDEDPARLMRQVRPKVCLKICKAWSTFDKARAVKRLVDIGP